MKRRYLELDVFGAEPLRGNALGVVLDGEGLSTEKMQEFASWTNFSETTFLLAPTVEEADYKVRIFTTSRELPFAGHPTLGSCFAWLEGGNEPRDQFTVIQECAAGLIEIRRDEQSLSFKSPPLTKYGPVEQTLISEVADALNIEPTQIVDSHWLDNGPGWIGVLLSSVEEVLALGPKALSSLSIGVFGFYDQEIGPQYETRAFFSENGALVEDPVTGSLNAAAAQWFIQTNRCAAPYLVSQGLAINRKGEVKITQDAEGNIWVGGNTSVISFGNVEI
ncbi:MAG: PhzF family phenazine biosynthesis protein [Candidatus Planktophila sp.]|nr:PhzF family phenazine biosynthesis protein [Candidatus Planktophila sp.]